MASATTGSNPCAPSMKGIVDKEKYEAEQVLKSPYSTPDQKYQAQQILAAYYKCYPEVMPPVPPTNPEDLTKSVTLKTDVKGKMFWPLVVIGAVLITTLVARK